MFCQHSPLQKYGTQNYLLRYKCPHCNKVFSFKSKFNPIRIWEDYEKRKQTYKQLAENYHCSVRTIQRYLDKAPKTTLNPPQQHQLNILADVTFFGRDFGILVLLDSLSGKVIYHQIVKTEKDVYYKMAFNRLREKGYVIQSITCDGRRGVLKDLFNTPTQMCQFHMVTIVMRALRKKH
ncbi:IS256 family transposase, variant Zn-binding type [Aggregatibacter actinomycetemcomitans]